MDNFIQTVITLFIILDPLGLAAILQGMLKKYPPAKQKSILLRELSFTMMILLLFFFTGEWVLKWLGLKPSTLSISGGILLFLVALGMVFPSKTVMTSSAKKDEDEEPFLVPIAMPLMAGPSSLALVMLYAAQSEGDAGSMWTYAAAIVTTCVLSGLTLFIARKLLRKLGEKGTIAMERMMGMVLILISVQMFMNGMDKFIHP